MNLIDCSYFYSGPLQVMNAKAIDDIDNDAAAVQDTINGYIERYQGEFLLKMVGKTMADALLASGDDTYEDLLCRLRLPFAHYVYFKLVGDVNQNMTIAGLMRMKSANENQPPRQRMVKVWNDMVSLNEQFVEWAESSGYDVFYHAEMVTPINQFNL